MPALRVDSQFTLIDAALKGYMRWRRYHLKDNVGNAIASWESTNLAQGQQAAEVERMLEAWCDKLLHMGFDVSLENDERARCLTRADGTHARCRTR